MLALFFFILGLVNTVFLISMHYAIGEAHRFKAMLCIADCVSK